MDLRLETAKLGTRLRDWAERTRRRWACHRVDDCGMRIAECGLRNADWKFAEKLV